MNKYRDKPSACELGVDETEDDSSGVKAITNPSGYELKNEGTEAEETSTTTGWISGGSTVIVVVVAVSYQVINS